MGFIREEFVGYECDKCGKLFEDRCGYAFHVDEQQAMDRMGDEGWQNIDGKFYCPNCCHYDEERDEYVVNKEEQE